MDGLTVVLKARELINKVGPTTIPVSIKAYVEHVGAVLRVEHDLAADEPGYSFESNGKHYICVNRATTATNAGILPHSTKSHISLRGFPPSIMRGRVGAMPSDRRTRLPATCSPPNCCCLTSCSSRWLTSRTSAPPPSTLLPSDFVASTMATGSRFATLAHAPCAFILSEQGKVRYASRSRALRDANAGACSATQLALPKGSVCKRTASCRRRVRWP